MLSSSACVCGPSACSAQPSPNSKLRSSAADAWALVTSEGLVCPRQSRGTARKAGASCLACEHMLPILIEMSLDQYVTHAVCTCLTFRWLHPSFLSENCTDLTAARPGQRNGLWVTCARGPRGKQLDCHVYTWWQNAS